MLELRDLVLKPGASPINHQFPAGRISVVLGRNHSGKTAFCRTLAGLTPLTYGVPGAMYGTAVFLCINLAFMLQRIFI